MAATSRMEEYFPRPLEYHPERWLRDDRAQWYSTWPSDTAYLSLPFSHGLRACPGKRFAEQGLYTAVTAVCPLTVVTCIISLTLQWADTNRRATDHTAIR